MKKKLKKQNYKIKIQKYINISDVPEIELGVEHFRKQTARGVAKEGITGETEKTFSIKHPGQLLLPKLQHVH